MPRHLPLFLCAALVAAEDPAPEPGPIPAVPVDRLVVPPREGDAQQALAAFLDAHAKDKAGESDAALHGYLRFLGMPGRHELPPRYAATARERLDRKVAAVRRLYDAAVATYGKDRARGVQELERLSERYGALPEGVAARALWHSDRLRVEIDAARALEKEGKRKEAAARLEKAVRQYTSAFFRYEAKTLLVKLGGPDLFDPGERVGLPGKPTQPGEKKEEDEEEPTIEIGDG